jgi:Flp pilus assembly protein CpaB
MESKKGISPTVLIIFVLIVAVLCGGTGYAGGWFMGTQAANLGPPEIDSPPSGPVTLPTEPTPLPTQVLPPTEPVLPPTPVEAQGDAKIVIALIDIPNGTIVTADMVAEFNFPRDYIVETMIVDVNQAVGMQAVIDIPRGVPVTTGMLSAQD